MRRSPSWLAILFVLLIATVATAQEAERKYKELPNFHEVNAEVFRGGQPQKSGLQRLSKLGIKTIINLRDNDALAGAEEAEARALGFRYFNIPFNKFGRPSDEEVEKVLTLARDVENQPVFIHCKRGSDRTGLVIAIYRILFDGWTSDEAKAEAKRYGMGFWQVKMKDYIGDYSKRMPK
jgi:protein tyrosine/serine phosphatase